MSSPREIALAVIRKLVEAGHRALVVGGAVRNELLGLPVKDFDVATSARPEQVRALFPEVVPVGESYGVVLVVMAGARIEVASFRSDSRRGDGRRPDHVTYTDDVEKDALRRDFTVNGMYLDPANGEVLDFVGGRADLAARRIRAIGDPRRRFDEDRLRLLRAVRFSNHLDFSIEAATEEALREMAPLVRSVSGERVRNELVAILTGKRPGDGLRRLQETGLLAAILPEVEAMVGVPQPPEFHPEGDVFTHTRLVLEALTPSDGVLALAGLLHDVGKPPTYRVAERIRFDRHAQVGAEMAVEICRRLKLSGSDTEAVRELVAEHLRFMEVRRMREAKLRRFLTGDLAEAHLALHRADCLGSHRKLRNWEFCREKRKAYLEEPARLPRLITGADLIAMGHTPGPRFARVLTEVEDRVLEGRLRSREEALEFARGTLLWEDEDDA